MERERREKEEGVRERGERKERDGATDAEISRQFKILFFPPNRKLKDMFTFTFVQVITLQSHQNFLVSLPASWAFYKISFCSFI